MPRAGQGAQEVPVPRATGPRDRRALGLMEGPVTGDRVFPWLRFPANAGSAIQANGALSSQPEHIQTCLFPPESNLLAFRVSSQELDWPLLGEHHPSRSPMPRVDGGDGGSLFHLVLSRHLPPADRKGLTPRAAHLGTLRLRTRYLWPFPLLRMCVNVSSPRYYYLLTGTRRWP